MNVLKNPILVFTCGLAVGASMTYVYNKLYNEQKESTIRTPNPEVNNTTNSPSDKRYQPREHTSKILIV